VGSIPEDASVWADLPGVRNIDFSDNPGLVGAVPEALAAAPKLVTM
jgi:hypothetical protein